MILRPFTYLFVIVLICVTPSLSSQVNVTTLGIQLKPMIPSKYLGTGTENAEIEDLKVDFEPNPGLNFGMVVRK